MGLFNILDPVLDAVFGPLIQLPAGVGLLILTFLISVAIVFIYKFTTDQAHMKSLRMRIKKFQDEMKSHKDDPAKMMKVQKKAMSVNAELMKHSMRPTMYTIIPIIIIFGWLGAHFSVLPIVPGAAFNISMTADKDATGNVSILVPHDMELLSDVVVELVDGKASWTLKGPAGEYEVFFEHGGEQLKKRVLIAEDRDYSRPTKMKHTLFDYIYSSREGFIPKESNIRMMTVSYEPVKPLPFSLFGWKPGWLGTYIIFSILFSTVLRKLLKVA